MQMTSSFFRFIQRYEEVILSTKQCVSDVMYGANYATTLTFTLPAVVNSHVGDKISIVGIGAGGWALAQNATQTIRVGSTWSLVGTGGSIASSDMSDCVDLVCIVEGTTWIATSMVGTILVATS